MYAILNKTYNQVETAVLLNQPNFNYHTLRIEGHFSPYFFKLLMCRSKSEGFCHLNLRDEAMIEKFIYRWKKYSLLIGIFEHYLIEPTILDKTNVSKV